MSAGDPRTEVPTQVALGTSLPALEVAIATDPGRMPEKQVNEDSALARATRHGHLTVVCDGMGGHVGGKEASTLAVETIFAFVDNAAQGHPAQILGEAIREANRQVHGRHTTHPELKGMGSTCVAILTHPGGTEVAHVGDSRVYLLTQQQLYQVTKDHSLVQRLVDANMITPEEAASHPSANQITNALGMKPEVEVEVRPQPFPFGAGDTFILCSDGLSDEIGPQDIVQILAPWGSCAEAAQKMIDLANARGGHDNITVAMVRFPGGGPFVAPTATSASRSQTPVASPILAIAAATATMDMSAVPPEVGAVPSSAPPGAMPSPGMTPMAPGVVPQFTPPPPPAVAPAIPTFTPAEDSGHGQRRRGGGVGWILLVVVVLLAAAGGAYYVLVLHDKKSVPTDPPKPILDDEPSAEPTKAPKSAKPKPAVTEDEPPVPSTSTSGSGSQKKPPLPGPPPKPTSTDTQKVDPTTSSTALDTTKTSTPPLPLPSPHPDNE